MKTFYIIETSYAKKEIESEVYKVKSISQVEAYSAAEEDCNNNSSVMVLSKKEYKKLIKTLIGGL